LYYRGKSNKSGELYKEIEEATRGAIILPISVSAIAGQKLT
jgi:hypothetical protein